MQYSRWEDAYIERQNLLRSIESASGVLYMEEFQKSLNSLHDPEGRVQEGYLWRLQREVLTQADPIYVSDDVTEIIDVARETFEPEPVLATDLFVPCGFALLPRAILLPDSVTYEHGNFLAVRAIAWMPIRLGAQDGTDDMSHGGLMISYYTHMDDDIRFNDPPEHLRERFHPSTSLSLAHNFVIEYGRRTFDEPDEEEVHNRGREQWKLVQVLWRLGAQIVPVRERLPRAFRRDMKRRQEEEKPVTIITLRKAKHAHEPEGEIGHGPQVQFPVRGHWRNQWYPSLKEHRQIWIDMFWKGPEDAPIRITQRVFEFTR